MLTVFAVFYGLDWVATVPPTVKLTAQHFGAEQARAGVWLGLCRPPDRLRPPPRILGGLEQDRTRQLHPGPAAGRRVLHPRRAAGPHHRQEAASRDWCPWPAEPGKSPLRGFASPLRLSCGRTLVSSQQLGDHLRRLQRRREQEALDFVAPCSRTRQSCSSVSTPSAVVDMPSDWPSPITALMMARLSPRAGRGRA